MADLVFITGATGFVGFPVLRDALKAGYRVRAAVRSEQKGLKLKNNAIINNLNGDDRFSYVVVPDFEPSNAFDEKLEGVKYVIHIASPANDAIKGDNKDYQAVFIDAAVNSTISLLESAKKAGTVERVVITSSAAAIVDMRMMFDYASYDGKVFKGEDHPPEIPGPYGDPMLAYAASKIYARTATEKWVQEQKPRFDVIQIHPSMVTGRDDSAETAEDVTKSTNLYCLMAPLGQSFPFPFMQGSVSLDDVAMMHVKSLDKSIPGNQSYLATSETPDGAPWNASKDIAKDHFPKAVEDGTLPCTGETPSLALHCDVSQEEKTFGFKFRSFEDQAKEVIGQYLELLGHAK